MGGRDLAAPDDLGIRLDPKRLFDATEKERIYQRDRGTCGICGESVDVADAESDHFRPRTQSAESPRSITAASCTGRVIRVGGPFRTHAFSYGRTLDMEASQRIEACTPRRAMQLSDIEKELRHYATHFKNKSVLTNLTKCVITADKAEVDEARKEMPGAEESKAQVRHLSCFHASMPVLRIKKTLEGARLARLDR